MPQPKGSTGNPNGRPVGSKNAKTKEWEALGEAIVTRHAERFNQILESCPDDKFAQRFLDLIEYFQPKLARTEVRTDGKTETIVRFEFGNDYTPDTASKTGGVSEEP